jgi:hypothetical protein
MLSSLFISIISNYIIGEAGSGNSSSALNFAFGIIQHVFHPLDPRIVGNLVTLLLAALWVVIVV